MWSIWAAVVATVMADCTGKFTVEHDGQVEFYFFLGLSRNSNSDKASSMTRIILLYGLAATQDLELLWCEFSWRWVAIYVVGKGLKLRQLKDLQKYPKKRPETHIIPRMLARWEQGRNTPRMNDSGVSKELYDEICSEFLLKIIGKSHQTFRIFCDLENSKNS